MAKLLLNLRHVPEDEAEEVRGLLEAHGIGFYETPPNRWGISMGGIWLADDEQAERARVLLDDYQAERRRRSREDWEARRAAGEAETFLGLLRREPLRIVALVGAAGLIAYFVVSPFFGIGG